MTKNEKILGCANLELHPPLSVERRVRAYTCRRPALLLRTPDFSCFLETLCSFQRSPKSVSKALRRKLAFRGSPTVKSTGSAPVASAMLQQSGLLNTSAARLLVDRYGLMVVAHPARSPASLTGGAVQPQRRVLARAAAEPSRGQKPFPEVR